MTERTATEILLAIEASLSVLEKRVQNSENLLKLLLSQRNNVATPVAPPQSDTGFINKDNFDTRPKTNKFATLAAKQGVAVDTDEMVAKGSDLPPDPEGADMVEAPYRASNVRGQKKTKSNKSSVSQVLSCGNSPLFLANVEILDNNGQLISHARTNAKGRWLMALAPGSYQVHVVKRYPPESGKKPVDSTYQIKIPLLDKPMELDPLSLGDSD